MKQPPTSPMAPSGLAYFIYGILFLMVIVIGGNEDVELFSLSIFFVTNLFFAITLEKDIIAHMTSSTINLTDIFDLVSPVFISISLVFEFVASILLVLTMNYLKKKFESGNNDQIELQTTFRENLDNTKIMFIFATISIALSAFGLFNGTSVISLDSLFKLITGSDKYMMEFVLGLCVFIAALASYILWKLNLIAKGEFGKTPGIKEFIGDYRVLYSIAAIYIGYIPFRIITRRMGWFSYGGISLDWAIPVLNVILLGLAGFFAVKMGADGTKVYANATSSLKQTIKNNIGVAIALFFVAMCGILMLPDWAINIFIKVVLPIMSLGISSYLLKRMFEMATINNKIVVR